MTEFPAKTRVTPALRADVVALGGAAVAALRSDERVWAVAAFVGFAVHALVRWGRRPVGFRLDGDTLWIADHPVPLTQVAVGPRSKDGRRFRLYALEDRVRTWWVDASYVHGASLLYATVWARGARVVVTHDRREALASLVRQIVPVAFGLAGVAVGLEVAGLYDEGPIPVLLFGGLAAAFATIDAAGVESPPLLVDPTGRRVWWFQWVPASEVALGRPRISSLAAPDVVVVVGRHSVRLGPGHEAAQPVKAAIEALGAR